MSVQHVVLLGFDPELDEGGQKELYEQVHSWPDAIGGFEVLRLGPPITTARTHGYHYLMHMVFPDRAALEAYQVHPVHRRFAEWVREHGGTVLGFDYEINDETVVVAEPAAR